MASWVDKDRFDKVILITTSLASWHLSQIYRVAEVQFHNLHTLQDATTMYKLGATEQWASQWVRLIVDRHRIKLLVPIYQIGSSQLWGPFTSLLHFQNVPNFAKVSRFRFGRRVLPTFYPTFLLTGAWSLSHWKPMKQDSPCRAARGTSSRSIGWKSAV